MKVLKRVLAAATFLVVLAVAVDFFLHPAAYLSMSGSGPRTEIPNEEPAPAPEMRLTDSPTPPSTPLPPESLRATDSRIMSPLDLEAVHDLIRDRNEDVLMGQGFDWSFQEASPFLWSPLASDGSALGTFLSVEGSDGRWFAVEAPDGNSDWIPTDWSRELEKREGAAKGVFVGIHRSAPTGSNWARLKRIPLLRLLEVEFRDKAPIEMVNKIGEIQIDSEVNGLEIRRPTAESTQGRAPVYRIVEIRSEAFASDSEFERCAPWSLTHVLYHDGRWLLSEEDYEKVEVWDRLIRNQFETFDSALVRQAVVADFIRLLGYPTARMVGVVFNGADGFPFYRWAPDPANDDPETGDAASTEAPGEGEGTVGVLDDLRGAPDSAMTVQDRLLEFLLSPEKSIVGGALQRTRQEWLWIRPWGERVLLGAADGSDTFSGLTDLIDLTEAEEILLRIQPVWFDDIGTRFGPADSLRTEPYPLTVPAQGSKPSVPEVSIVWHVYGGIRVGKASALVEGEEASLDAVVAAVDVAKYRRVNRPMGLASKNGR